MSPEKHCDKKKSLLSIIDSLTVPARFVLETIAAPEFFVRGRGFQKNLESKKRMSSELSLK